MPAVSLDGIKGGCVVVVRRLATPCWEWRGATNDKGYGYKWVNGKSTRLHRVTAALAGKAVSGRVVMHECDNRRCCNPEHLKPGTQRDNMRDMARKGRARNGTNG